MSNKNHFLKKSKGIAMEESRKRDTKFLESLDGKSYVPSEAPQHTVTKLEKRRIRKPKIR